MGKQGSLRIAEAGPAGCAPVGPAVPCFTPGTGIVTDRGERSVETLQVGDRVLTRDNGLQQIRWAGQRFLTAQDLAANSHLRPILISRGALGPEMPDRDMLVSPQHRVLVSNELTMLYFAEHEVLVAARHLIGLPGIRETQAPSTRYIHFMCDRHQVVLSDSAWTETFQPGDRTLGALGNAQRLELFELFPELDTARGGKGYAAARKTLRAHEATLLRT